MTKEEQKEEIRQRRFLYFLCEVKKTYIKDNSIVDIMDKLFEKFDTEKVVELLSEMTKEEQLFKPVYSFYINTIKAIADSKKQEGIVGLEYEDIVSEGVMKLYEVWKSYKESDKEIDKEFVSKYGEDFYKEGLFAGTFKKSFNNRILDLIRNVAVYDTGKASYRAVSLDAPLSPDTDTTLHDIIPDFKGKEKTTFKDREFYNYILDLLTDPIAREIVMEYDEESEKLLKLLMNKPNIYGIPKSDLVKSLDIENLPIDTPDPQTNYLNTRRRENLVIKAFSEIANLVTKVLSDKEMRFRFGVPDRYFK